jgi:hypothetical protein
MMTFCAVNFRHAIRMMLGTVMTAAICIVLPGCEEIASTPVVHIADDVDFQLLSAESSFSLSQKVTAHIRGERHMMIMQAQADTSRLALAGMSPTGTRLFSLSFDGNTIESWKSPLFTIPFDGSYVLADFELVAFSVEQLQPFIFGGELEEKSVGDNIERKLINLAGDAVIEIIYPKKDDPDNTDISYCHLERHYCLDITLLERTSTP